MMKRKKRILSLVAALLCAVAMQAQNAVALYQANGQVTSYYFTEAPRISYAGDCLLMTSSAGTVQYSLRGLRKIAFAEMEEPSAVKDIKADGTPSGGLVFSFRLGQIAVSGAEPGAKATLFDLDGKQISVQAANTQGRCTLSTAALPKGVYVIQIGKTSYKFVK